MRTPDCNRPGLKNIVYSRRGKTRRKNGKGRKLCFLSHKAEKVKNQILNAGCDGGMEQHMCGNNSCIWIILILIILFCCGGCGFGNCGCGGCGCDNNNCGCGC